MANDICQNLTFYMIQTELNFGSQDILYCFPNPSITECKHSNAVYCKIIIGSILSLPIFFFLAKLVRILVKTRDPSNNRMIHFLVISITSYVCTLLFNVLPYDCSTKSAANYFSFLPISLNTISYIILAEEAAFTLRIVSQRYSNILKYALLVVKYICTAFILFIVFCLMFFTKEKAEDKQKIIVFIENLPQFYRAANIAVQVVALEILIATYIFTPILSSLIRKKTYQVLNFLTMMLAVYMFIDLIINIMYSSTPFVLIAISKGINAALYAHAGIDFVDFFIPRIIQTAIMWILFNSNLDNLEDSDEKREAEKLDQIVLNSLMKLQKTSLL